MSWQTLVGTTLPSGWLITNLRQKMPGDSGGAFSVQFDVTKGGAAAFMKAFDFDKLVRKTSGNTTAMQHELESINHEKLLLQLCLDAKTKSVAVPLEVSQISVAGVNGNHPIDYIIFEKGNSDLRRYHNYRNDIDYLANLIILRNVALGLSELHTLEIAHQDLKPSNVVLFQNDASQIVDLGRASHKPSHIWHDGQRFAGDPSYAPIEILYDEVNPDWYVRRMAGDLYMLGSLVAFLFTGVSLTAQMLTIVQPQFRPASWTDPYPQVVPYLRDALRKALSAHGCFDSGNGAKVANLIRELCDPDPAHRGAPRIGTTPERFSMRRYLSIFDRMIVEVRIKGIAA